MSAEIRTTPIALSAHGGAARTELQLAAKERERLDRWAADAYPAEACGLLLGRRTVDVTEVVHARRARNRSSQRDRFVLDPVDHLAAEDEARALGLAVVGVWHSHPDQPAVPSQLDRTAAWSGWSYVIVSVGGALDLAIRSWRRIGETFVEERVTSGRDGATRLAEPDA